VHALHTVHALPDLRIAAGRLRDGFYHALLFATADLRLLFCARSKPIFEVRGAKLATCENPYRINAIRSRFLLQHLQISFGQMLVHTFRPRRSWRRCGSATE
jgi:hypothetical protein